jgi:hypothetical protein
MIDNNFLDSVRQFYIGHLEWFIPKGLLRDHKAGARGRAPYGVAWLPVITSWIALNGPE